MSRVAGDPAGKHAVRGPDGRFRPTETPAPSAGDPADERSAPDGRPDGRPVSEPDAPDRRGPLSRLLKSSLGDLVRNRG